LKKARKHNMNLIEACQARAEKFQFTMKKTTFQQYQGIWQDFLLYLEKECKPPIIKAEDLRFSIFEFYLSDYQNRPASYNQRRSAIITLLEAVELDYAGIEIHKLGTWAKALKRNRVKQTAKPKLFMSKEMLDESREMIALYTEEKSTKVRNLLMWDILNETWLRLDELRLIDIADIDFKKKTLGIRGKGASGDNQGNRVISNYTTLSDELIEDIQDYLNNWRASCDNETIRPMFEFPASIHSGQPLLTTRLRKRIGNKSIYQPISSAIEKAWCEINYDSGKIPSSHGPHSIRRSCANIFYRKRKDIVATSRKLRHTSLNVTMLYLGINENDLVKNNG